MVKLLLERGATIDATDNDGDTALHMCEDPDICRLLLFLGANPHQKNANGLLPIQVAYENECEEVVEVLRVVSPEDVELCSDYGVDGDDDSEVVRVDMADYLLDR